MKAFRLSPRGLPLLLVALCIGGGLCPAQFTFERTYSGYVAQSVQQTSDGGFIIAGRAASYDATTTVVCLAKMNSLGDTIWTRRYGRGRWDGGYSAKQTFDGGYIVAGITNSGATGSDVFLVKTDPSGDTLWTRVYGGPYDDWGYSVQQTSDSGYIVAGYSSSSQGYYKNDAYLIKTDASGDTIWTRTYGGTDVDQAYSVGLTSDGGYIVAGSTRSYDAGRDHVYLVRTSATGDTLWTRTYAEGAGRCVEQTSDGGYIIAGYPSLVKTDSTGEMLWQRSYTSFAGSEHSSVQQTSSDGGYILVGTRLWPTYTTDLYVIKTDIHGDTLWTTTYGGPGYEDGNSVQQTSDGGYIIAGTTDSYGTGSSEMYLIKTGADGFVDVPSPLTLATPADGVKGQSTSPTLIWNISQRATSYRLQVAMNPSFTELIFNDSSLVNTSRTLGDLLNFGHYYWRVKGENQHGTGQYSHVWSFTTIVAPPVLVAPVDGASNQAATLALVWHTSAGTTYYRVQVALDSTFGCGLFLDDSTLVDTARLVSGLAPGTRYFWHVNAMGTGGTSIYSPVWSFETQGQIADSQWVLTGGTSNCRVHALAACRKNIIAMTRSSTDDGNVLVTTDSGNSWKSVLYWPPEDGMGGGPLSLTALGADALVGFAAAGNGAPGAVRVSSDSGLTWETTIGSGTIHWPTTMAFDGSRLFLGYVLQGMALFRKNASDWTYASITPPSEHQVRALAIIESTVFAATNEEGLFLSTNEGETWDSTNNGLTTHSISSIVGIGSTLLVGTSLGVYLSTNNGSSWSPANLGLTNRNISSFAASEGFLFAGTDSGAFLTSDSGKNWNPANQGLETRISALAIGGGYLYAGTSSGVWRRTLADLITSAEQEGKHLVSNQMVLEQNYPNPFNPLTIIKYTVGGNRAEGIGSSDVTLIIYDVLGRQVAVLVNERKLPGQYEVSFDGSALPSGVYFYRLRAGSQVQTRNMLLIK